MSVAAPTTKDYLVASNAAYCEAPLAESTNASPSQATLMADASKALQAMGDSSWKVVAVDYIPGDGFYGAAYVQSSGNLIIAYEGTSPNTSTFGVATLADDAQILARSTPTKLVNDVNAFTAVAETAAKSTAGFDGQVYVTGHSLGGIEAEFASLHLNIAANNQSGVTFSGGVTFGATGIPGYSNTSATAPKMTDYVDYGDPVGNYASNMPANAGKDFLWDPFATSTMDHVGTVVMEGNPSSWNLLSIDFLTFDYHYLTNYQADLGVSITGAPVIPGLPYVQAFDSLLG